MVSMNRAELARFTRRYRPNIGTGCWEWQGPFTPNGYGKHRIGPGHPERVAHRIAYEHYVGPIPDGLQLDHTCRVRRCVNPSHLEPVTGSENTLRQDHAERRVTHCPKGHPYDEDNTIRGGDGKRRCRECDRARKRQARSSRSA